MTTFVGLDAVVGVLTGNGASRSANQKATPTEIKIGVDLIRASIVLQMGCFAGFILLEIVFHRRCIRAGIMTPKLKTIIALLYTSSALILIRNIYRVINVWQGPLGFLETHEEFFYIFDAAVMLINSVMLNIWHPLMYLPNDNKTYLAQDGVTERQGPGWVDKRPFLITLIDPFDIGGLIRKKDNKEKFWENEETGVTNLKPDKAV